MSICHTNCSDKTTMYSDFIDEQNSRALIIQSKLSDVTFSFCLCLHQRRWVKHLFGCCCRQDVVGLRGSCGTFWSRKIFVKPNLQTRLMYSRIAATSYLVSAVFLVQPENSQSSLTVWDESEPQLLVLRQKDRHLRFHVPEWLIYFGNVYGEYFTFPVHHVWVCSLWDLTWNWRFLVSNVCRWDIGLRGVLTCPRFCCAFTQTLNENNQ